jgi:hypothetical protein
MAHKRNVRYGPGNTRFARVSPPRASEMEVS